MVSSAYIADGRKAAVERVSEHPDRVGRAIGIAVSLQSLDIHVGCVNMDMSVDESGHECSAPHVDHLRLRTLQWTVGDFANHAVLDQYVDPLRTLRIDTVEYTCAAKKDLH